MTLSRLTLFCLLAAAPLASAQDETVRTGTVGARVAPPWIENINELEARGHYPKGYTASMRGTLRKKTFVVRTLTLVSPDRAKTITLTRFEGVVSVRKAAATPSRKSHLVADPQGAERTIEPNAWSRLERYLKTAVERDGAGRFKVRGWLVDTQSGSSVEQSLLLDGVEVEIPRLGRVTWAERVYKKSKKDIVLVEPTGNVQLGIKGRFVQARRQPLPEPKKKGMTKALPQ